MKPLEDELRRTLRRREPPPGFTGRVLNRVREETDAREPMGTAPAVQQTPGSQWAGWAWFGPRLQLGFAAVAVALLLAISLSLWHRYREEQQHREGEAARAQVIEALRITSAKLNRVRAKVDAASDGNGERLVD